MEEITKTSNTPQEEPKMISVEQANAQLQNVAQQASAKLQHMAMQVQQLDAMLKDKTLEFLFKVMKYSHMFSAEFVVKCTDTIEKYLTQVALSESNQENTETPDTDVIPAE